MLQWVQTKGSAPYGRYIWQEYPLSAAVGDGALRPSLPLLHGGGGRLQARTRGLCSFEELRDFTAAAAALGVTKLRVTGGEPLVRRGIVELCAMLRAVPGIEALPDHERHAAGTAGAPLKAAGVDRLNISLDTLRPERYREITRTGKLENVLRGIEAAERAGFENIKLNCVLLGGMNDDEIGDFVRLTAKKAVAGAVHRADADGRVRGVAAGRFLPAQEALPRAGLRPAGRSGVAQLYRLPGAAGMVGLIEPMSCAFCADCTRIRITADGSSSPACTRTRSSRCAVFPARSWKRPSARAS